MVDLMLQRLGEEPLGIANALLLAIAVERLHGHPLGTIQPTPEAWHRQTAFVQLDLAAALDDLRIDDDGDLVVDLDDGQTQWHADLRRRQATPGAAFIVSIMSSISL